MPEWLTNLTIGELFVFAAAIAGAGGFIWKFGKPTVLLIVSVAQFLEDWNGKDEVQDAAGNVIAVSKPSMKAKIIQLEDQVQRIHHETTPNHGGSMNDALRRVEARVIQDGEVLTEHLEQTAAWQPMLKDLHDEWSHRPTAE